MALYLRSGGSRVGRGQSLQRLLSMVAGSSGKSTNGGRISHQANFSRRFSIGNIARQWKNETPPGSLTEIYVYAPDQDPRVWPDPVLGVFAPKDPRCCLPGNLGLDLELQSAASSATAAAPTVFPSLPSPPQTDEERARVEQETAKDRLDKSDLLTSFTRRERQAQALYSANDYLQNTADAEATACQDILEVFPRVEGAAKFHCKLQEAPQLLRSDLGSLFPGRDLRTGNLSVITLAQRTLNDMTGWSEGVEEEREKLVEIFMQMAQDVCSNLRSEGYWADFIDPTCGKPYYSQHTNTTFFETDERYRLLGFTIEDLGCCKVITHPEFGRNVMVGTLFTDAHPGNGVVQDVFDDLGMELDNRNANKDDLTSNVTAAKGNLADALGLPTLRSTHS